MKSLLRSKWSLLLMTLAGLGSIAILQLKAEPPIPPGIALETDIIYGKGGDRDLKLNLTRPKQHSGKMPAVVFIHGGGWSAGTKEMFHPFMYHFTQAGVVCITVEYRLAPKAIFPAQIEDVKCAVRWLRANAEKYNVDPERIAALGASAGAHLAALLGTTANVPDLEGTGGNADQTSHVCAVVGLSGPYDLTLGYQNSVKQSAQEGPAVRGMLEAFLGGTPQNVPSQYQTSSPITHVSKATPPMMLTHGTDDTLVLIEQSDVFEKKLKENGVEVEYLRIEGGTHNDFGKDPNQVILKVGEFLKKHLKM